MEEISIERIDLHRAFTWEAEVSLLRWKKSQWSSHVDARRESTILLPPRSSTWATISFQRFLPAKISRAGAPSLQQATIGSDTKLSNQRATKHTQQHRLKVRLTLNTA